MWRIKEPEILRRATELLSIEPSTDQEFRLSDLVVPVVSLERLLTVPRLDSTAKDISAGAGAYVPYFTVPEGERWWIHSFCNTPTTGLSAVMANSGPATAYLTAPATAESHENNLNLPLEAGWTMGLRTTGNGADTSITLIIWYELERIPRQ